VRIGGARPARAGARAHLEAGLAHIPSDRLKRGLVPEMTLAENLILGLHHLPELGPGPFLDPRRLDARARGLLGEFDVRPADPRYGAGRLSGGNQQKMIAARELSRGARAVLAAHPTRGVDLGAVAFIHRRLLAERDAAARCCSSHRS
jgi:simple sugar transport system ATP-binding protein